MGIISFAHNSGNNNALNEINDPITPDIIFDTFVKSRHTRESGYPGNM